MAAKKGTVIRKAKATNQPTFAELLGARELDSGNLVLLFEDSEVVMPGGWRLAQDLVVGDFITAWWDEDGKFHLEWGQ